MDSLFVLCERRVLSLFALFKRIVAGVAGTLIGFIAGPILVLAVWASGAFGAGGDEGDAYLAVFILAPIGGAVAGWAIAMRLVDGRWPWWNTWWHY